MYVFPSPEFFPPLPLAALCDQWCLRAYWADPGVLWKKAPRAIRAMRGKTLQTVPFKRISTVLWVQQKLPQSTVSQAFPSNKSYESKAGCNRTPATVLWVPLTYGGPSCCHELISSMLSATLGCGASRKQAGTVGLAFLGRTPRGSCDNTPSRKGS